MIHLALFGEDKPKRLVDIETAYTDKTIWFNLCQRFKFRTFGGERLVVDLFAKNTYPAVEDRLSDRPVTRYTRRDAWTQRTAEELHADGYHRADGFYDSLIYWRVPVYIKLHGLRKFDVKTAVDEKGVPLFSQDTSATLHDVMQSSATQDFIKGMGKTSLSTMDTQKIIMIAIIGAGALFGMWMLGVI